MKLAKIVSVAAVAAILGLPLTASAHGGGHGHWKHGDHGHHHGHKHGWRGPVVIERAPVYYAPRRIVERRVIVERPYYYPAPSYYYPYSRPAVTISVPPVVIPF